MFCWVLDINIHSSYVLTHYPEVDFVCVHNLFLRFYYSIKGLTVLLVKISERTLLKQGTPF